MSCLKDSEVPTSPSDRMLLVRDENQYAIEQSYGPSMHTATADVVPFLIDTPLMTSTSNSIITLQVSGQSARAVRLEHLKGFGKNLTPKMADIPFLY